MRELLLPQASGLSMTDSEGIAFGNHMVVRCPGSPGNYVDLDDQFHAVEF
jgi:hypothetical protein